MPKPATAGLSYGDITDPTIAWPMDPTARLVRNGSRLNAHALMPLADGAGNGETPDDEIDQPGRGISPALL